MRISTVTIHNFRSIKHQSFNLQNYSLIIGANNVGKSNIIDALRIFYEKDLKFSPGRDFPKFETDDQESWIELEFELLDEEYINLKDEFKQPGNKLRVRKYLKSSNADRVKANQSNIFGYEGNNLSDSLFYGARNISSAKLGDIIYIPDVTKIDEYTKLSGPSAFRNILDFVVKRVVKSSSAFEQLSNSFDEFNSNFRGEDSTDGISIKSLIADINNELKDWNITFNIDINQIKPEDIIKNLVTHYLEDEHLINYKMDAGSYGQGLQRHLIYTLIKLSTKYKESSTKKDKKDFNPEMIVILFEEPEAFLHPAQQDILNLSLKRLAQEDGQQVIATTHSTHFVSKNIDDILSIIKLVKDGPQTIVYQIDKEALDKTLEENKELKNILGEEISDRDLELESIRYCLWLDPDRCCSFFANKVLICEGLSEKALIDTLVKNGELHLTDGRTYILNAGGKHDIHRYMNLFGKLGIKHSILFDGDNNKERHKLINDFIEKNRNAFTSKFYAFDSDIEDFFGIPKEEKYYKKPLNIMWHYRNNMLTEKLEEFKNIILDLLD
ncbi:MAG: AAA family ATPase [Actinomycetota bacterium]|nr:AAA family ATPase [Actinomycetota bacterium]